MIGKQRRTRDDILAEMLEESLDGINKYGFMFKDNLSSAQVSEYMELLMKNSLIEPYRSNEDKLMYRTTMKGREYLHCYRGLEQIMEGHINPYRKKELADELPA